MILYEMLVGYPPFASETPQVFISITYHHNHHHMHQHKHHHIPSSRIRIVIIVFAGDLCKDPEMANKLRVSPRNTNFRGGKGEKEQTYPKISQLAFLKMLFGDKKCIFRQQYFPSVLRQTLVLKRLKIILLCLLNCTNI